MGTALLRADLGRLGMAAAEFAETLKVLFREAWFQDALLFLDGLDAILCVPGRSGLEDLLDELAETGGITIMAGTTPWCGSKRRAFDVATVSFRLPEFEARRTEWRANLGGQGFVDRRIDAGRTGGPVSHEHGIDRRRRFISVQSGGVAHALDDAGEHLGHFRSCSRSGTRQSLSQPR